MMKSKLQPKMINYKNYKFFNNEIESKTSGKFAHEHF